jgi:ABC-type branched-subunit amino acid transport system substrate-binding protein
MASSESKTKFLKISALLGGDEGFEETKELFQFMISSINDHQDGWLDDILVDTKILYKVENSECNELSSVQAYMKTREEFSGDINVVIGPMCSAGAIATGWLTSYDDVAQVTHVASSSRLSDKKEFPWMSRLVSPDDERGEVGAMVALLRGFEWDRVSIISTDSAYANNYVNELKRLWVNYDIATSQIVTLNEDGSLNKDSVYMALEKIPVNDPTTNSKIIVLVAYIDEAYSILEIAQQTQFQEDTIWVASSTWCDLLPQDFNDSFPDIPGYIGITPYRNRDEFYSDFLERFQSWQYQNNRDTWEDFPSYYAEYLVDAVQSVARTFSLLPFDSWDNTSEVVNMLRNQSFEGISGHVSFTNEGDRENPIFSLYNMQRNEDTWQLEWVQVGEVGTQIGSSYFDLEVMCFAAQGCNQTKLPSDKYPIPPEGIEIWVIFVIVIFSLLLFLLYFRLRQSQKKKRALKMSMTDLQTRIATMQKIDNELLSIDDKVESARLRRAQLFREREELQEKPDTWSDSKKILIEVLPHEEQYWKVNKKLQESMNDAYISKLWRVQNISLWTYYSFHKDRLSMNGIPHNEKSVWHGTSSVDPAIIYNDKQDGFMMQYSRSGFWG